MGKFVIKKRNNGEFQFSLQANNGQPILTSEGYLSKAGCENGIASVKINEKNTTMFELKESPNRKFYFNLKASNGHVIGTSEMYESIGGRANGVVSVIINAQNAAIEDQTR